MAELSEELMEDILSRLPVKDLLRFRCVSKPLRALIDSSRFVKSHLNRSIETNTNLNLILLDDRKHTFHSVDLDSPENRLVELDSDCLSSIIGHIWCGSCNGLYCFFDCAKENSIVLWNPSTRKYRNLPECQPVENGEPYSYFYNGFGYESNTDDYKLIRIVQFDHDVDVYSLKSNSWRRVPGFPPSVGFECHDSENVLVRGALHWLGTRMNGGISNNLIIAFDLGVEEFRFVPPPPEFPGMGKGYLMLGVLHGCLSVISSDSVFDFDVWVMKDYWTKLYLVEDLQECPSHICLRPITCSTNGDRILFLSYYWGLYQYEKKKMKKVKIHGISDSFAPHVFLESLVQVDGGSDQAQ